MTTMTNTNLSRAAEHVGAVDLGGGRWAHYADETGRWYVVAADDLAELCVYLDDPDAIIARDAYSHWCAGSTSEEMPQGWTPDTAADWVTVETMPDYLRASHRAAGNWGRYPVNGACRYLVHRDEAAALVDADEDGYAHVVGA